MRAHRRSIILSTLLALALTGACQRWTEATVFVRAGQSADQRKQVAKEYVTEQNLISLRSRLKQTHPTVAASQFERLYLKWKITDGDDETAAVILVGIHGSGDNDLLAAAVSLVEADLNGPARQR